MISLIKGRKRDSNNLILPFMPNTMENHQECLVELPNLKNEEQKILSRRELPAVYVRTPRYRSLALKTKNYDRKHILDKRCITAVLKVSKLLELNYY